MPNAPMRSVSTSSSVDRYVTALLISSTLVGVFQAPRLSSAFALVRGVEGQGDESSFRQELGVQTGGLLLDSTHGMGDDDGGMLAIGRGFGWKIELTDDGEASAEEFDATGHGVIMMRAEDGQVFFFSQFKCNPL